MAYDPYNQLQQPLPGETVYVYVQQQEQDDQERITKPMATVSTSHTLGKGGLYGQQSGWHNTRRQPFFSAWALEFSALVVSISALVSAAVVLSKYDGKRLEEWGPGFFGINLNTVISALGVISKANLAFVLSSAIGQHKWNWFRGRQDKLGVFDKFEQASRGPWGSANLLLWSRATNWAALGALVTIVALLIDPFLQATVSLRGQNDQAGSLGSLPVAHDVRLGKMIQDREAGVSSVFQFGPGPDDAMTPDFAYAIPDFGLTSAVYAGLDSVSVGPDAGAQMVRFSCGTGNCTWPLYTTAAVCSRCSDVSRNIVKKKSRKLLFDKDGSDIYWGRNQNSGSQTAPNDTFGFTSYEVAYAHIKQFDRRAGDDPRDFAKALLLTAMLSSNYSESVSFQDMNTTFATILIMRASHDFTHGNLSWEDTTPVATECGLYLCAKAYTATAIDGKLNEAEVGTWAVREPRSWRSADTDHPGNGGGGSDNMDDFQGLDFWQPNFALPVSDQEDVFRTDLQILIPEKELLSMNANLPSKLQGATGGNTQPTKFNISQETLRSMSMAIRGLFTLYNTDLNERYFIAPYPNLDPFTKSIISDILWVSNDTEAATQNFSAIFEPLANRLTLQMREASNLTHTGQADAFVLYFHVTWGFFLLLVITLSLGGIYFAGVLFQTFRLQLPAWKESAVSTLVYGLDGETQSLLRKIDSGRWSGQSMDQGASNILTATRGMPRSKREKVRDSVMVGLQNDAGDGYTLQMVGLPQMK